MATKIGDYVLRKHIIFWNKRGVYIPVCRVYGKTQRERELVFSSIIGGGESIEFYESKGDQAPSST